MIGEGWHVRAGEAHAEVSALADARARGTTCAARRCTSRSSRAITTAAHRRASMR